MLPEFADGRALPAPAGFGTAFGCGHPVGKVLSNISGDGGAGATKIKLASQFIGQQREVQGLAVWQKTGQEIVGGLRPRCFVVAARGSGREAGFVTEPLMAKPVKLGRTEVEALRRRERVELAGVEGGQNLLHVESWHAVEQLFFSWKGRIECCPQARKSFSHWTLVEKDSAQQ